MIGGGHTLRAQLFEQTSLVIAVQAAVAVADDRRFGNLTIADLLDIALEEITTKGCLCKRPLRRLCAACHATWKTAPLAT